MAVILSSFYRSVAARRAPDPRARAEGGKRRGVGSTRGPVFWRRTSRPRPPEGIQTYKYPPSSAAPAAPPPRRLARTSAEPLISRQLTDEADNLFTPKCLSKMTRVRASAHADGLLRTCAATRYLGSPSVLYARRPCCFP